MNSLPVIDQKNPKVSIGIPTFNRAAGLKKTLECLTNQSYTNIEIIVSDNCSPTKEVEEIAMSFADIDHRVQFYKQSENMGAAFNFKFVLQKANGEYFMWAADDDWWDPTFIERIILLLQQKEGAIAGFCNYTVVNENGHRLPAYPDPFAHLAELTVSGDFARLSRFINQYEGLGKSNIFYSIIKTSVIQNIPFDLIIKKVPLGGDLSLIYSWLCSGNIVICKDVLRNTTIGNVKQNSQFITEFPDTKLDLGILYIYTGKLKYYWDAWGANLFFYFYLTSIAPLSFLTKSLLYLSISKKIILFFYDLICYNVVTKGVNLFDYLKRKPSLVQ